MEKELIHDHELGKILKELLEIKGVYRNPQRFVKKLEEMGVRTLYDPRSQILEFTFPFETPYFFTKVHCVISFYYEDCDVAYERPIASYEKNEIKKVLEGLFDV